MDRTIRRLKNEATLRAYSMQEATNMFGSDRSFLGANKTGFVP